MSGRVSVFIVDDEPPARARLAALIEPMPGFTVCGEAGDGKSALAAVASEAPDIVLMDIRMPGMDGIEAARHLAALPAPPAVIFTTAYDAYALEAFETQAIGYLLKPVRRQRLADALEHAVRPTRAQLGALAAARPSPRRHVSVRRGETLHLLPIETVRYFEAAQKYVTVHHAQGEDLIDDALKSLEAEYVEEFVRAHRSLLVSVSHIAALDRDESGRLRIRLRGTGEHLAISRRHAADIKRKLRRT